jgi:hypothetical protein
MCELAFIIFWTWLVDTHKVNIHEENVLSKLDWLFPIVVVSFLFSCETIQGESFVQKHVLKKVQNVF